MDWTFPYHLICYDGYTNFQLFKLWHSGGKRSPSNFTGRKYLKSHGSSISIFFIIVSLLQSSTIIVGIHIKETRSILLSNSCCCVKTNPVENSILYRIYTYSTRTSPRHSLSDIYRSYDSESSEKYIFTFSSIVFSSWN